MDNILDIDGRVRAALSTTVPVWGISRRSQRIIELKPGTARLGIEQDRLIFTGDGVVGGRIYVDLKCEDVRSFFLNFRPINVPLVVVGSILLAIFVGMNFIPGWSFIPIFMGPYYWYGFSLYPVYIPSIVFGVVLLSFGIYIKGIHLDIRTHQFMNDFIHLHVRHGTTSSTQIHEFIDNFWEIARERGMVTNVNQVDEPKQGQAQSQEMQGRWQNRNDPANRANPVATNTFTCFICDEVFPNQGSLQEHVENVHNR